MNEQDAPEPEIIYLWFDPSLYRFIPETLALDGIPVTCMRAASDTLNYLERLPGRAIVLIDNYQVSEEARAFAHTLFARPDLHQRVKLIGIAASRHEDLVPLDEYLKLPFTFDDLLNALDRAPGSPDKGM